MKKYPFISLVIPVKNGGQFFSQCLKAVRDSDYSNYEIIVMDDSSEDNSAEVARSYGALVLSGADFPVKHPPDFPFKNTIGPAAGRNIGARHAKGEILLFIDADVLVKKETLSRVADNFINKKYLAALFGTYDNSPGSNNFLSQYRNLLHRYIHQISLEEAGTFWSGCGAILKSVFLEIGGFDLKKFRLPCIEDIELGYRLKDAGYRIFLDKNLEVTHLKKWNFYSMVKTDVFHRAIPWLRVCFKRKIIPNDLNLQTSHRISGLLSLIIFFLTSLLIVGLIFKITSFIIRGHRYTYFGISLFLVDLMLMGGMGINLILLNRKFYSFLWRLKGFMFMLKAIPVHFLYYLYSTISFLIFLTDFYLPWFRSLRKKLGWVTHV